MTVNDVLYKNCYSKNIKTNNVIGVSVQDVRCAEVEKILDSVVVNHTCHRKG